MTNPPVDNLVRAWAGPQATSIRANDDGDGNTLYGHFAVFDKWTEIDSWYEGKFLERIAPGAFTDTFKERGDKIRVLYDHGADPMIGNKPLGAPEVLREDGTGAYYEVSLFDSSYVNDLKPALRAGQLGASFRFRVTGESRVDDPKPSKSNPKGLPERTITGVELYEFGPVTFPAYPDASAGMRSRTDEFLDHFLNDPQFVARFKERVGPVVVQQIRASLPPTAEGTGITVEAPTAPPETTANPADDADGEQRDVDDQLERRIAMWRASTAGYDAHIKRLA